MSDLQTAIARNIRAARKRLGVTQEELAREIGAKSSETISTIEKGEREVKAWELHRIARRLHVDFYDLMSAEELKLGPKPLWRDAAPTDRPEVEGWLLLRSRYYRQVMDLLDVCPAEPLAKRDDVDPFGADFDMVSRLGENMARVLHLGVRPAKCLFDVLEDRCVMVFFADLGRDGSALSVWNDDGPAMLLNSREPPWRRAFSCAHELFHLLTWDHVQRAGGRLGARDRHGLEKRANAFASALLMPSGDLLPALQQRIRNRELAGADVVELARDFWVSTKALLWRLYNLRIIPQETPDTLLDNPQFRKQDREARAGVSELPTALPGRFVELAFEAYTRALVSRARLAEMLGTDLSGLPALLAQHGIESEPQLAYQAQMPDPGR